MATQYGLELAKLGSLIAAEHGEWAGYPVPIEGLTLTVSPRFSNQRLEGATLGGKPDDEPDTELPKFRLINRWWSWKKKAWVLIAEDDKGRFAYVDDLADCYLTRQQRLLQAIEVTTVQDHAAELMAVDKLKSLIPEHLFAMYVLQGCFLETSKRSRVTYLFRKSRPTLAMARSPRSEAMNVLAGLCLHPIGYYEETFHGAMVPTDEVVSHLLLMRADEHRYWRTANQHPPYAWQAGI